jgi:hypothetical protein
MRVSAMWLNCPAEILCAALFFLFILTPTAAARADDAPDLAGLYEQLEELQSEYLKAYQNQFIKGTEFKKALRPVKPPPDFSYSKKDLAGFNRMLEKVYKQNPAMRSITADQIMENSVDHGLARLAGISPGELGRYQAARDLAHMTGLPLRELAVYHRAHGRHGMQKLIFSVKNLANRMWVSWYLFMQQSRIPESYLFNDHGDEHPGLLKLRQEFVDAINAFNRTSLPLGLCIQKIMQQEKKRAKLNRLAAKAHAFDSMYKVVGRIDVFGKRAGEFPLEAKPRTFPQAAILAKRLAVPFQELAYIQRRSGINGLRLYLTRLVWIKNHEELEFLLH